MSAPLRSGAVSNRVVKSLLRSTATCVSVTATSQAISLLSGDGAAFEASSAR